MKLINKYYRIVTYFSLIIVCFFLMQVYILNSPAENVPRAKAGILDLTQWDLSQRGVIKLDGEWEFYPDQLMTPDQVRATASEKKLYIKVPGTWNQSGILSNLLEKGVGTYKLTVNTNTPLHQYGIKLSNIRSSCKIFINDTEILKIGNPTKSMAEGYQSKVLPSAAFFTVKEHSFDIIIQVANLDYYNGGILQSITLGSGSDILDLHMKHNILDAITIASLLISGCYCLGFHKRKRGKLFFYVGLLYILFSLTYAISNEKLLLVLFPSLSFLPVLKLKIVIINLSTIYFMKLIKELSTNLISDKLINLLSVILGANVMLILTASSKWFGVAEYMSGMINVLVFLILLINLVIGALRKKLSVDEKYTVFYLAFALILMLLQYLSIVLYINSITKVVLIPQITFFLLLFSIFLMLSKHYSRVYENMERLSLSLIAADKIKDEYLVKTAQQFKTPLHNLIHMAQLNVDEDLGDRNQNTNMKYIISIATRLSTMVNDIIDLKHMQYKRLKLEQRVFDVNSIAQAVTDVFIHMRRNNEVELVNHIPPDKYFVYADENRLKQILVNLMDNSLKFTEKGSITIDANVIGKEIYINVKDTGIGIAQEQMQSLFLENLYDNSTDAVGMGLMISKKLANCMGGDLYCEYTEIGLGSVFTIKLPLEKQHKVRTPQIDLSKEDLDFQGMDSSGVEQTTEKLKLLIVDDDICNIKVLKETFQRENYDIVVAYNGTQALEYIKSNRNISIVLLDVMMPGLSGYEVCKRIRQEYQLYELPIILITVSNTPEDIAEGLESGANDYVVKPFNLDMLKIRVKNLQEMKNAVKEALKMENVFLQSQIKPHFLYNALNTIVALCYTDGERAGKLLGELSYYLRGTFELDPHNSSISIEKELAIIGSYLELEKARFGDRLTVKYQVDDSLIQYRIPALIVQPLVENAVRHGIMKRLEGGWIEVRIASRGQDIVIEVKDNGVGISNEHLDNLLDNNYRGSSGLRNVNRRLVNEYGKGLFIKSKQEEGTTVVLHIPIPVR